jgi:hypothetical protein
MSSKARFARKSWKALSAFVSLSVLYSIFLTSVPATAEGTASVTTDKATYETPATVTITGNGWLGNSDVDLAITGGSISESTTAQAGADGAFSLQAALGADAIGEFTVAATGADSTGAPAEVSSRFNVTDPSPPPEEPAPSPSTETEPTPSESPAPSAPATIVSDKADYPAGSEVTLTGENWLPGETVHIRVNDDIGATWLREVDVVASDDGHLIDVFRLPDWFVATYRVKATGMTSDRYAETTFTDSAGTYTINFSAADPGDSPTYPKVTPAQYGACPAPSGGSGRASDPLADAIFGNPKNSVESMAPEDMVLGQIVPFELKIAVSGSTDPEGGRIQNVTDHSTVTTNAGAFGYDASFGVYCAFVDPADSKRRPRRRREGRQLWLRHRRRQDRRNVRPLGSRRR